MPRPSPPPSASPDAEGLREDPGPLESAWSFAGTAAVAFSTGVAVLVLEVAGTRILAPVFGVTVYTWTAVIGATLVALAAGYAIGGLLSERRRPRRSLFAALALAGVSAAWTPYLARWNDALLDAVGLRVGVLSASFLLFFLPLASLATVVPLLIRLRAGADPTKVARRSGSILAVSTAGSFVGAVGTGFWALPNLDLHWIFGSVGGSLLAMAALVAALDSTRPGRVASLVAAIVTGVGIWMGQPGEAPPDRLHVRETLYGRIEVYGRGSYREIRMSGVAHTNMDLERPDRIPDYLRLATDAAEVVRSDDPSLLLLGLGGGSVIRVLARAGYAIDVVEIDPQVIAVAEEYFDYDPASCREVFVEDARSVVGRASPASYDAIVVDVFRGETIPEHLWTVEFFEHARRILRPEGLLVVGLTGLFDEDTDRLFAALWRTLRRVFPRVRVLTMVDQPDQIGNFVWLAGDASSPGRVPERPPWRDVTHRYADRSGPILTDRRNSLDVLFLPVALRIRRLARSIEGRELLVKESKK